MIELASTLAIAAMLSLTSAGSASAFDLGGKIPPLAQKGGGPVNVGDPFLPNQAQVDPREACLARGGTPKNQIESDGSIGIRCIIARR